MPNGKNFANLACSSSSQKLISFVFGFPKLTVSDTSGISIGYYNPFRYRGYYYDVETGLYYLQSRYYDPVIGRFLNSDDAVIACIPSNIIDHNLFIYCFNEAVNFYDESGRWPKYFRENKSEAINCYSYVLGRSDWRTISINFFTTAYGLYIKVYNDLKKILKLDVIKLGTNRNSKKINSLYYIIAMRIGHGWVNGKWLNDFHFWVRHENYSWSHKPGKCVSELIGWDSFKNPSKLSWNIPTSYKWKNGGYRPVSWKKNFYNSSTYYLAIKKD